MKAWAYIFVFAIFGAFAAASAVPQTLPTTPVVPPDLGAQVIDGVAARIDTDVITESELGELADFQILVDGKSKGRDQLIEELSDQWIVTGEADTAHFPHPSDKDVDAAYAQLVKQFPSQQAFDQRRDQAGLTADAVRRQLAAQLYLSRFLDFRFRPAAEVNDADVQKYYDQQFTPQLKSKGEAVPPLARVQDTIREVLIQQDITNRANQWLDDTRTHLEIDVLPQTGAEK